MLFDQYREEHYKPPIVYVERSPRKNEKSNERPKSNSDTEDTTYPKDDEKKPKK